MYTQVEDGDRNAERGWAHCHQMLVHVKIYGKHVTEGVWESSGGFPQMAGVSFVQVPTVTGLAV